MKTIARIVSWIALAATLAAPVVFLAGKLELDVLKICLNVATIVWFIATPVWMKPAEAQ